MYNTIKRGKEYVGTQFDENTIPSGTKYSEKHTTPYRTTITAILPNVKTSSIFKRMLRKSTLKTKGNAMKKDDKIYNVLNNTSLLVGVSKTNAMFNIKPKDNII